MKALHTSVILALTMFAISGCSTSPVSEEPNPLPSWNDGATRTSIVSFMERVTLENSPGYIPVSERIAVFDNDGTLWSEKPIYFQFLFVLDRVHALAADHPNWVERQPFKAVLEGDFATLFSFDDVTLGELFVATHSGITNEEFEDTVRQWMETARHPETGKPYTGMVYKPMLELLDYLRANQFRTFIVSGGGIGFMRPWIEDTYGISKDQVVGSSGEMKYEQTGEDFVISRLSEMHFINDKANKPVGIQRFIGRRPIIAVGNSDGDYQMLQWTTAGEGERLGILLHHTDAEREWAYDRETRGGKLAKGLDDAPDYGWTVIDMARDWNTVYPPSPSP